jgi:hypothetical protein
VAGLYGALYATSTMAKSDFIQPGWEEDDWGRSSSFWLLSEYHMPFSHAFQLLHHLHKIYTHGSCIIGIRKNII